MLAAEMGRKVSGVSGDVPWGNGADWRVDGESGRTFSFWESGGDVSWLEGISCFALGGSSLLEGRKGVGSGIFGMGNSL